MKCPAFFSLLVVSLILLPPSASAQQDSAMFSDAKAFWKNALFEAPPVPYREEILKQLEWQWECLGPNSLPEERNPGGKAIPAYAVDRGNGTGRINYLFVHPVFPEKLWACSPTGGVWLTENGGLDWSSGGTDQLPVSGVSSIAVDPKKSERWVIATGDGDDVFMFSDGIWITRNGGLSYESLNGNYPGHQLPFGQRGDFDGQIGEVLSSSRKMKHLFVASNRGLWKSSGALRKNSITWTKIADGRFYDIVYIRGKRCRKDILVAAGDKVMISYNGGRSWIEAPTPNYPQSERFRFLRISLAHSPDEPRKVFTAVTCSESHTQSAIGEGTLQVFDLDSREWTLIRSLREGMNNIIPTRARAFAISPVNANILMCGNVQPLYRSIDRGISFSKIDKNQMHDDCHHIVYSPDGKTIWAAHDGGVSMSTNGGMNFIPRDKGIGAANVFGLSVAQSNSPQVLYGGYDTGGNLLRDGKWWHVSWGDGFETITSPSDRNVQFTTMQNGTIHRSINGLDFEENVTPSGARTEWHTWIRMHPVNTEHIYCAGNKLMRSTNLGSSWESVMNVKELDPELLNAYRFYLSPEHPGVMYVYVLHESGIKPQIWRTFNISETKAADIRWERVAASPVDGWIMNIIADPDDARKFWVLFNHTEANGKIWYFDGINYSDYTANLGGSKCESMVLQRGADKRLYVGSHYGVFTRKAGEAQWTLLTGLPGTYVKSLDINYPAGKLVVGTFGRGVWWGDLIRK